MVGKETYNKQEVLCVFQVTAQFGLLYVITKYGMLYICDLETAACLGSARISSDVVFSTILNSNTDGLVGVSRGGQVSSNFHVQPC